MSVLVWRPGIRRDGDCRLYFIEDVEKEYELRRGVSRAASWPDDAHAVFSDNYPKDIALSDSPDGTLTVLASPRLREELVAKGVKNCEFLPLALINHKGRVATRDYCVVHPLEVVDCIDLQASGAVFNHVDWEVLMSCTRLVLKHDAIPEDLQLFRPLHWPQIALIKRSLADHLLAQGFTGLRFIEPLDYTGD
jgi:hypothetical protein